MNSTELDPITASVLGATFPAIAEEMHRNLIQSAYSTIVRESRDASTCLLTADGELLAQGQSTIPVLLGAFAPIMDELQRRGLLDGAEPGHAFVTNDPYGGGQHLDDIALVVPVFAGDTLIGYAGAMAHHIDIGAAEPGLNPLATTVHQEGLRIPPMRIDLDRDLGPGGVLASVLGANIRVPDQTLGDLRAQIAAVRTGARRLRGLSDRYGIGVLAAAMAARLDYGETMMRYAVAAIPDGEYAAAEHLDGPDDGSLLTVRVKLTVTGDQVHVDLTGTDPQTSRPLNAPLGSTISSVSTAVALVIGDQDIPVNAGSRRVLTLDVPQGSLLNPVEPAPVSARMNVCFKVFDAVMAALAQATPESVIASSYSAAAAVALCATGDDGRTRIYRETLGGGYGAGEGYSGADGCAITLTNTANVPTEFAEQSFDYFRVESHRMHGDPGAGAESGGRAVAKTYRILTDDVQFAGYSDHHHSGPAGLHGGGSGTRARFVIEHDGHDTELAPLVVTKLRAGDLLRVETAAGGGYGRPDQEH